MSKYMEHVCCMRCGKKCSGVDPELGLVVRAWVECPECLEKSEGNSAKSEGNSSPPIPRRLHEAIQHVLRDTREFNERKQEWSCSVCRFKDVFGTKLHDPDCSIYELHSAWEEAIDREQPV